MDDPSARLSFSAASANVLLVDDTRANLVALEAVLLPLGCRLIQAASGREALAAARDQEFAVMLIDIVMPGMSGFETASLLRELPASSDVPLIFMTAYPPDNEKLLESYAHGAVDVLVKPLVPEIVQSKVSVFVELYVRRRQIAEERRARGLAEAAARAREQTLAVVSHDLKNPMSSIMANLHLLETKWARGATIEEVRRHGEGIRRALEAMNSLVTDLLEVSQLEAQALPLSKHDCDARELCQRAVDVMAAVAAQKSQRLKCDAASVPVTCDADRILRVLSNLIANAVKFTPEGGHIEVLVREKVGAVLVAVQDTGPGIAPHDAERVFDRFWQANAGHREGVGLGLAIARGIVEAHGGRIWAEPANGGGSRFCFTLPRAAG